jgi:GTP-binding protein
LRLGVDAEQVIAFSASTGEGRDELAVAIESLLEQPSWKAAS